MKESSEIDVFYEDSAMGSFVSAIEHYLWGKLLLDPGVWVHITVHPDTDATLKWVVTLMCTGWPTDLVYKRAHLHPLFLVKQLDSLIDWIKEMQSHMRKVVPYKPESKQQANDTDNR